MTTATAWWAAGTVTSFPLGGQDRDVFVAREGDPAAPVCTLLHGYPASTLEWAELIAALAPSHRCIAPDFLGFGASAKPRRFVYDIDVQADLVESVWARDGVEHTTVLSYDYGTIVAQELLCRQAEGRLAVTIDGVITMNAGMLHAFYRPTRMQTRLADPRTGWFLQLLLNERRFGALWRGAYADPARLTDAMLAEHWRALTNHGGRHVQGPILSYITQREERAERWEGILSPRTPFRGLIWGMADPVSGAHVLAPLRERLPQAEVIALTDAGHCPHIEQPAAVAAAVQRLLA